MCDHSRFVVVADVSDLNPKICDFPIMSKEAEVQEIPMVNVQIDGKWHRFPKGTRMIEAIHSMGTEVPHYCYHPKLSSPGNCRMCLVEMGMPPRLAPDEKPDLDAKGRPKNIGWMPRPVISCANTVAEGMGIRTKGKFVEECREGVMEFLLANHPLDCPICDQAGECRLQEFSVEHGKGESRFVEQKVKKPKNVDIGERITLDDERCIMCSRCIRFCDEIIEDHVLGFTDRGSHTTLAVHPGKRFDSNYSLNTVDICPVGALTSNDFRFQMRVWFLKETKSIDINCGTGSNIVVWTRGDEIYRITPRENNSVNSTWMPDSHRLAFHEFDKKNRLTQALIGEGRAKKDHKEVTLRDAIGSAKAQLQNFDGNEVAIVASARMTNEELYLIRKLADTVGVSLVDVVPRSGEGDDLLISDDGNPNSEGAKLLLLQGKKPGDSLKKIRDGVEDKSIKAVLAFGEDLLSEEAGFTKTMLGGLKFLLQSHVINNGTAEYADVVIPGAIWCEKRGTMINVTGRLQRMNKAYEPIGGATDDWEFLRDLMTAFNGESGGFLLEDVIKEMAEVVPEWSGISFGKIGDEGIQLLETGVEIPLLAKELERRTAGIIG